MSDVEHPPFVILRSHNIMDSVANKTLNAIERQNIKNALNPVDKSAVEVNIQHDKATPNTTSKMSLILPSKERKEDIPGATLPDELQTLISSLYLDVTKRLCLETPFRCANELSFCYNNHYRKEKPLAPNYSQVSDLLVSWQQARYVEFIKIAEDMCPRAEFPGEGVFEKLIELILTTNYERNEGKSSRQSYAKIVCLFRTIVNAFPPCWIAMRSHYINFFNQGLDINKLNTTTIITTSNRIVNIIFDLIDYTFANYSEILSNSQQQGDDMDINSASIHEGNSIKSQCFSQCNWNDSTKAFCNLKTDSRLERINIILGLLLSILEIDLSMWILHHHENPKHYMFWGEVAPLVVLVFDMSQSQRSTNLVQRLFQIFAKGIAMRLNETHLKLVERWIALVMVASHTADLEDSVIGIRYPALQPKTREMINDFFRHFKADNRTCLKSYFICIDLLRVPYVKYEFVDRFLRMFRHSSSIEMMSPNKIADLIARKNYLHYKKKEDISEIQAEEEITREQYFELLLKALRAYCDMYGFEKLFKYICLKEKIPALQTVSESVHRFANGGIADNVIKLDDMAKDKDTWSRDLNMDVRMSRPKVNLPPAEVICVDKDVIAAYRSDLKYCTIVSQLLLEFSRTLNSDDHHVDEWMEFCNKYKL